MASLRGLTEPRTQSSSNAVDAVFDDAVYPGVCYVYAIERESRDALAEDGFINREIIRYKSAEIAFAFVRIFLRDRDRDVRVSHIRDDMTTITDRESFVARETRTNGESDVRSVALRFAIDESYVCLLNYILSSSLLPETNSCLGRFIRESRRAR